MTEVIRAAAELQAVRRVAIVAGLCLAPLSGLAQESGAVFRAHVDLSVIRVQVMAARNEPLPTLVDRDFSVRVGQRAPTIRLVEQVPLPTEAERRTVHWRFFRPIEGRVSAVYLIGFDQDDADCRQTPQARVQHENLTIRATSWTLRAGCAPPGARKVGQ